MAALLGFGMLTALAACDNATAGQPRPKETTSQSSPETSTEESTSGKNESDYSLARLCDLLSPDESQQLGGSAEGEKGNSTSDGHAICTWAD